jgi:Leu/Phe-tRNA-protein transferase
MIRRNSDKTLGLRGINKNDTSSTAAVSSCAEVSSEQQMMPNSPKFKKMKTSASKTCKGVCPPADDPIHQLTTDNCRDGATFIIKKKNPIASTAITPRSIQPGDYLPIHLKRYVQYSHGDFYVSSSFEPRLIAQLMYEGFLPIATPRYLVPKLHKERCVIYPLNRNGSFPRDDPQSLSTRKNHEKESSKVEISSENIIANRSISAVHISKNVKKRAKNFRMTINQAFDQVIQGCHDQHGIGWLYPPIVEAFRIIHEGSTVEEFNSFPVRLYSIEVWNATTGKLAGGELGYAVGTMYTSLTGFACEDSAGSVQLAALGQFLWSCGFELWDFGMKLDYKSKLGAKDMSRDEFVAKVKELRGKSMGLMRMDERICCKSLITGCVRKQD